VKAPSIRISDAARKALLEAMQVPGEVLRLTLTSRFEPDLYVGDPGDDPFVSVDCDGITIVLDPPSAARANGVLIDYVDGPDDAGFSIDNPNRPGTRRELKRDCVATLVPSGSEVVLSRGEGVTMAQALGNSFTVETERGLARIESRDADALGIEVADAAEEPISAGPFSLERVVDQLRTVFDPEIPVNVVDLGLIYGCDAQELPEGGQRVEIRMSMTAPGCGMGDVLREDARAKILTLPGVAEVDVEIVWDPPWDSSRMSDAARLHFGML
jgi:probable FeS assembly SUF system protein SufT